MQKLGGMREVGTDLGKSGMEKEVDCTQNFVGRLPFIGEEKGPVDFAPKKNPDGSWSGVRCVHSIEKPSPHLTTSHIESAAHVLGDGKKVEDVFSSNPEYSKPMNGVHIVVKPQPAQVINSKANGDKVTVTFNTNDTYTVLQKGEKIDFADDRIVTKSDIEEALEPFSFEGCSVLVVQFEDGEGDIKNWPYLTNEAIQYILDKGVKIIGLNIPSMDREVDGGETSNHKLIFEDQNRLIVESLNLSEAPLGTVNISLKPGDLSDFDDVASCKPSISKREHIL